MCHKLQTKQAMCEIRVRPFQDRTAKRQAKSLRGSRPTCQMVVLGSPGGRDWPYPAGWRLKTRKTKKKGKGRRRGRSSKTIVKTQKGTGIRTIEDPQLRLIALKWENCNRNQAWRTACNTGGSFSSGRDMTSEMYRVDIFFNSQVFFLFLFFLIHVAWKLKTKP